MSDPRTWDDVLLAARCAAREEAAWLELLRRAGPAAEGALRRAFARTGIPGPNREAAEAMGDWASMLLERDGALLRAYRPPVPLAAYLAVIARTVAFRILRKRHPGLSLEAAGPLPSPEAPELPGSPEGLAAALPVLPERDRLLLRLLYWEGLSYAQVAGILGISPASMGPLVTRAREALRKTMES